MREHTNPGVLEHHQDEPHVLVCHFCRRRSVMTPMFIPEGFRYARCVDVRMCHRLCVADDLRVLPGGLGH